MFNEEEKEDMIFKFFDEVLGRQRPRTTRLNFQELGVTQLNLAETSAIFAEEEVWNVINEMPSEKAPRPDGFTGLFYKVAWPIIKRSVIWAFNAMDVLDSRSFHLINDAYLILLPKKAEAKGVRDYRPINLIHSFSKLFAKALSLRASRFVVQLVRPNQSAFIKGRHIRDNFRFVHLSAKLLHSRKKTPVAPQVGYCTGS